MPRHQCRLLCQAPQVLCRVLCRGAVSGAGVDLASIASAVSTVSTVLAVGPEGIISNAQKIVGGNLADRIASGDITNTNEQFSSKNIVKAGGGYLTDSKGNVVTTGQGYSKFRRGR